MASLAVFASCTLKVKPRREKRNIKREHLPLTVWELVCFLEASGSFLKLCPDLFILLIGRDGL